MIGVIPVRLKLLFSLNGRANVCWRSLRLVIVEVRCLWLLDFCCDFLLALIMDVVCPSQCLFVMVVVCRCRGSLLIVRRLMLLVSTLSCLLCVVCRCRRLLCVVVCCLLIVAVVARCVVFVVWCLLDVVWCCGLLSCVGCSSVSCVRWRCLLLLLLFVVRVAHLLAVCCWSLLLFVRVVFCLCSPRGGCCLLFVAFRRVLSLMMVVRGLPLLFGVWLCLCIYV